MKQSEKDLIRQLLLANNQTLSKELFNTVATNIKQICPYITIFPVEFVNTIANAVLELYVIHKNEQTRKIMVREFFRLLIQLKKLKENGDKYWYDKYYLQIIAHHKYGILNCTNMSSTELKIRMKLRKNKVLEIPDLAEQMGLLK